MYTFNLFHHVENEAKDDPSAASQLLMELEQVTKPKTLQAIL
jgi:hypothetical protein